MSVMYLEFYGLKEQPFNVTPDPEFFFCTSGHEEAFYSLLYGIRTRKGFMQLTGPVGTGKTTLYRTLLDRLGTEIRSALIINPKLSDIQLIHSIIEDFEIKVGKRDRKSCFDALNSFLMSLAKAGSTALLIIDEAHNLKPSTLEQIRLLSNFETNKAKLLQILLVGQPELTDLLAKPSLAQIRQRITMSVTLSPLDRNETERYIHHRIKTAGGQGMLIFDSPTIDEIYRFSQGIPRLINILCDKALFLSYMQRNRQELKTLMEHGHPAFGSS